MIIQICILQTFFAFFSQASTITGTIIGGWIFGLGMGGLIVSRKINIINPKKYIMMFQYGLGIVILLFALFSKQVFNFLFTLNWFAFPLTFLFVTGVGTLSGTTFLIMNSFYKKDKDVETAKLNSFENFGAAFGSVVAGILLLPFLGIQVSLILTSVLSFGVGFSFAKKDKILTYAPTLFIPILIISFVGATDDLTFRQQSEFGEVVVLENSFLQINGRTQCSFKRGEETAISIVNYTLNSIDYNKKILVIGLGCGWTLEETLKYTEERVDIVEINKAVVSANREYSSLLVKSQVHLIVDEGLNYLRNTDKKYDTILIDIENPSIVHASTLFTSEAFEIIHDSLNDEGVFGLWIYPCSELEYYDIAYNTLKDNFNNVYFIPSTIFISSDKELAYEPYVSFTNNTEINTLDKKALSTYFLNNCRWNNG